VSRFTEFASNQTSKTIRRPSRIFALAGYQLFQRDRPAVAWQCIKLSLAIGHPPVDEYLLAANCLYQGLGRLSEAIALLTRANDRGFRYADSLGLSGVPWRVLDNVWTRHIGHLGLIDYVLKLGILEGRGRNDTILYLPPGSSVANPFLLQQIATQLRLVENPANLPFPSSATQAIHYDLLAPRLPDLQTCHYWRVASDTYSRWHRERRPPLFKFPPEAKERGWAALRSVGVPDKAWFVTFHVREAMSNGIAAGMNAIRNANIASYYPAMNEITRRGGWVIRIGDPNMTPLPAMPRVIDYCHSTIRADWMDIFLLACCRFMVGTNSGPAFVPAIYGVPAVLTNWWPAGERPWQPSDIFIPKLLRRISDGRYLTFSETLREPLCWCYSQRQLAKHSGVYVEDNEDEAIRGAVAEMLASVDAASPHEEAAIRWRGDRIYESRGINGMARLAHEFLRRHGELIN
jgi:putative glycosyltransferase (TIGR04372 family)